MIRQTKTENGLVRGIEAADPRITAFRGVPFAAPPTGKNRWRAPQPCEKWEGIKDCARFAPISVQDTPGIGDSLYNREWHVDQDVPMDEDCLYLNIWTGAKSVDDRRPVLVWYFGGGYQWGYTREMEFDGERLARQGVVVVTVNYRVNVFGFLSHPQLTKEQPEAPSNFHVWVVDTNGGRTQNLAYWTLDEKGYVNLNKTSANPDLTNNNSCYSLAGAVYGIYTEWDCINQVGTLTTDEWGNTNTVELNAGTYYVKGATRFPISTYRTYSSDTKWEDFLLKITTEYPMFGMIPVMLG